MGVEATTACKLVNCRICKSSGLRWVFSLGNLRSCGIFPRLNDPEPPAIPLELVRCSQCGLVQLGHEFSLSSLFGVDYGYRSGINENMAHHLGSIVAEITQRRPLHAGDVVVDIGSNDGTLLNAYGTPGITRVGIDPTIAAFGHNYHPDIVKIPAFFSAETLRAASPHAAQVITSIAMFYDLPDPNAFVADISACLAPQGLWIVELSYLPAMISTNSFDTICAEHLEYYTFSTLSRLLAGHDLRILDISLNAVNGGSFQVWVSHRDASYRGRQDRIDAILSEEEKSGYDSDRPFRPFRQSVEGVRGDVLAFLTRAKADRKTVHGYGASTKGNTLLQHFGITRDLIPVIADRNESKRGCRTPGTSIPIISEEESRRLRPDYYFVLPWHFRDGFLVREQAFLKGGGRFVFPLPQFEVVSAGGIEQHARA
jgi:NDP-4-keto-2,6-dideoxyhexose 3-C-methyltransferase